MKALPRGSHCGAEALFYKKSIKLKKLEKIRKRKKTGEKYSKIIKK